MVDTSFEDLNLSPCIIKALKEEGYKSPTAIQQAAIPLILRKRDLIGCAQTGTGKTAAFALPVLHLLVNKKVTEIDDNKPGALVLCPTRELALQIGESFSNYGQFSSLSHAVVYGGVPIEDQIEILRSGINILIATPGRLLDLHKQGYLTLTDIEILVLDEADRMLDMGFREDLTSILKVIPQSRQTLLFSATISSAVKDLASVVLNEPETVEVNAGSYVIENINQSVYFVEKKDKPALLNHVLKNKGIKNVLVFTRTKTSADELAKALEKAKIKVATIHGSKSQESRQRALENFKDGSVRVLVATDVAARGIDIEELKHVINYELPIQPETYVHRIGRTGRAGTEGAALSFCEPEELQFLKDIKETIGVDIPFADHPYQLSVKSYTKSEFISVAALPKKAVLTKKSQGKNKSKKRGFSKT
ncbi:DEAD/DEAH box helicase [Desertivirga arenae]|uniref:DEAD/DEAH box helicase n=1 Tax=Desertivirga arenae TaxID=2810309 RepID=UPI001A96A632|nr:DEAD/DEAH box helicase [Pedobacter sp. SYSU D00823]